jgi:hypothetical protein
MKSEMPSALVLLRDWSIWLVSLQTGALGLVSFVVGKKDNFGLNPFCLKVAMSFFAASIVSATFVLAAIPDIAMRMATGIIVTNFYEVPIFSQTRFSPFAHTELWIYTLAQHWFFMFGLVFVVVTIWLARKKSHGR